MKKLIYILRHSAIVRKTILRLVSIELVVLLLLLLCYQLLFMPKLRSSAVEKYMEAMNALSVQVESQVDYYASYSQFIIHTDTVRERIDQYWSDPSEQNYALLSLALTEQLSSSKSIRGLQLEDSSGMVFRSAVNLRDTDFAQLDAEWYQSIRQGSTTKFFSTIYDPGLSAPGSSLAYARTYYIGTECYTLTLFFNCAELVDIMEASHATFDGVVITDYTNTPFYELGNIANTYSVTSENFHSVSGNTSDPQGHYFFADVDACSWRLIGYVSNTALMSSYWNIFSVAVLLCIAMCLLTTLIAILIMGHSVGPIHQLSDAMQRISAGDRDVTTHITSGDEIEDMSIIFNRMLQNLRESMDRQIAFESNEHRMRYNLLLAQIDSHFIGNTMSSINSLARQGRTAEVIAINTALLKIIQNNLRIRDLDITDTIAQEMEIVEQYWLIMKIRQENQAELIWDIPDELLEFCIPKNLIQPLVENSLFHGLTDGETGEIAGRITVSARDTGDTICIQVVDNGAGIPLDILEHLNRPEDTIEYLRERGRHIGIPNIRQRLEYFYKTNCVHISCDNGTVVTLNIPKTLPTEEMSNA